MIRPLSRVVAAAPRRTGTLAAARRYLGALGLLGLLGLLGELRWLRHVQWRAVLFVVPVVSVLFVVYVVFVLFTALLCGFVPLASARFTTVLRMAQKTGMSRGGGRG